MRTASPRIDDLIVQLAQTANPVEPLAAPSTRVMRWTAGALTLTALAVIAIGPRADLWTVIRQPAFMVAALATLATSLLSAAAAFVLGVPGAERSPVQRMLPLMTDGLWAFMLIGLLAAGSDPLQRIMALPVHWACVIEIAGVAVVPGWALFAMLRRAAPLRRTWSAALATLAAVSLSAAGTQLLCPVDDPAHQLVGHVLPVALLAVWGAIAGRRSLDWLHAASTNG